MIGLFLKDLNPILYLDSLIMITNQNYMYFYYLCQTTDHVLQK